MPARNRVVGINFDHMHMGDLLRQVHDHPEAEIGGICDADPARMATAIANFAIPPERVFTDVAAAMAQRPDLVILCPATADWKRRCKIRVRSRFMWVDCWLAVRCAPRCCGRDVRRVGRGDRRYRSARRAGSVGLSRPRWQNMVS